MSYSGTVKELPDEDSPNTTSEASWDRLEEDCGKHRVSL